MNLYLQQLYGTKLLDPMEICKMDTGISTALKPLVIYHGNCADGFSAAWCFHHYSYLLQTYEKLGKKNTEVPASIMEARHGPVFEYHAGVYQDPPPDVTGRTVYMVDFSYKKEVVKEMLSKAEKIWFIDHHKTAIEDLQPLYISMNSPEYTPNLGVYVSLTRSGAMLAWDFLFNNGDEGKECTPLDPNYERPPILLEHVQDRDLWKFKLEGTRPIQAAMFSHEYTMDNWDAMMLGGMTVKMKLWTEGEAIERKHFKDIEELLKLAIRFMHIDGYLVPVCNLPYTMASDAGNIMSKDSELFAATYFDTKDHRVFSLRSNEHGLDVSEIARKYGGGGHIRAAGFKVPREHPLAMY